MKLILPLFLVAILSSAAIKTCYSFKILIACMQTSGHLSEFGGVGETLVKRGHDVHIIMDEAVTIPPQISGAGIKVIGYSSPNNNLATQNLGPKNMNVRMHHDCEQVLFNEEFVMKIEAMKFDFALVDGLYFCYTLLPYQLNIPFASISTVLYPFLSRIHPLAGSNEPCNLRKETNTFINRLSTFFIERVKDYIIPRFFITESKFLGYTPDKPYSSLHEVQAKASLFIVNSNGVMDCPRSVNPNVIMAGGLAAKPANPLPKDLDEFVQGAEHGIIVMSFGSMLATMSADKAQLYMNVFARLKQRVIWRFIKTDAAKDITVPFNVRLSEWLPQNDLLGNPKTKIFITHAGNNGQTEAIYHGVPMLCFPQKGGDQAYNADRVVIKGYGLKMNFEDFTSDELYSNLQELIDNPKYGNNMKKASAIMKSLEPPRETAAYWIEHVIQHGADHLRPSTFDMDEVQYLMIDIFFFIFVLIIIVSYIVRIIVSKIVGKIMKKKDPKKND